MQGNKGRGRGFASMSRKRSARLPARVGKPLIKWEQRTNGRVKKHKPPAAKVVQSAVVAPRMPLRHRTGTILQSGWCKSQPS